MLKTVGAIFVALIIIGAIASSKGSDSSRYNSSADIPTYKSPVYAIQIKGGHVSWYKGGFDSVMIVSMTLENQTDTDAKDPTISCSLNGESGTLVDTVSRTAYVKVKAHGTKYLSEFNMGFIDHQAATASCSIDPIG